MARRRQKQRSTPAAEESEIEKLRDDLESIARQKPGGTPENPIVVSSPVQVETRAEAWACPLCEAGLRLDEHVAEVFGAQRLRVARCHCLGCGVARELYFRLESSLQS